MLSSLRWKLMGVFGVLIVLTVILSGLLSAWATSRRFEILITLEGQQWAEDIAPVLEESYARWGSWRGLSLLFFRKPIYTAPARLFVPIHNSTVDWWQVAAEEMGIDLETLVGMLKQLGSPAAVARQQGIEPERLVEAIVRAEISALDQAAVEGSPSEPEVAAREAQARSAASEWVHLAVALMVVEADESSPSAKDPSEVRKPRIGQVGQIVLSKWQPTDPRYPDAVVIQTADRIWVSSALPASKVGAVQSWNLTALSASPTTADTDQVAWTSEGVTWLLNKLLAGDKRLIVADAEGYVVFDSAGERRNERMSPQMLALGLPLHDQKDGSEIGRAIVSAGPSYYSAQQRTFMTNVRWALVISGLVAGVMALTAGLFLAQRITAPVRALTGAAHRMAEGDLGHRLPVRSQDELGQMSAAFNTMAERLEEQRTLRYRLVDDIAHELNTPLSIIQLELEALGDGIQTPQEAAAHLKAETALLRTMIDDLTLLAEADEGVLQLAMEPVALAELSAQAVARWKTQAEENGVELAMLPAGPLPAVQADPLRLSQVLSNLIANALQHTPRGGRIEVRCEASAASALVPGRPPAEGEPSVYVTTTVTDTGGGILPQDLPHIFERFYRADRSRSRYTGGRGLGLAIVRQIVERHGGQVWVKSEPGQGSTFGYRLPAG